MDHFYTHVVFHLHLIRISYNHMQTGVSLGFSGGRFTRLLEAGLRLWLLAMPSETGRLDAKHEAMGAELVLGAQ